MGPRCKVAAHSGLFLINSLCDSLALLTVSIKPMPQWHLTHPMNSAESSKPLFYSHCQGLLFLQYELLPYYRLPAFSVLQTFFKGSRSPAIPFCFYLLRLMKEHATNGAQFQDSAGAPIRDLGPRVPFRGINLTICQLHSHVVHRRLRWGVPVLTPPNCDHFAEFTSSWKHSTLVLGSL